MTERHQDLVRIPDQLGPEPFRDSGYFSSLPLGDIYGRTTLKPGTEIVTDIPLPLSKWRDFTDKELREIADRYGIPRIGSYHQSTNADRKIDEHSRLVISAGVGAPMTNWSPFVAERGAIAALAESISDKDKPVVLEVGAGNGFTSRLLAADNNLRVVGINPSLSGYKQLPDTPGDVTLREADIFDLVEEFGPSRSPQDTARIKEILERIKGSFMEDKNMYFWGMQHGFFQNMGYGDFGKEVEELRRTAGKYKEQSPVDLVVCSFMTTGDDLTLAIRDGIRPKAIVYVMPLNGLSGVGNYYFDEGRKRGIENEVVSFNPGGEYQTVARWQTFWRDEWSRFCYDQVFGIEQADVIVQLRKDVQHRLPSEAPLVRSYGFDEEIAEAIKTGKRYHSFNANFFQGIGDKMQLLPSGISVPYRRLST